MKPARSSRRCAATVVAAPATRTSGRTSATWSSSAQDSGYLYRGFPGRDLDDTARRRGEPARRATRLKGRQGTMAAKYELGDDSVVVIVGSGAGGGRSPTSCAEGHRRRPARGGQGEHRHRQRRVAELPPAGPGSTSAPPRATGGSRATSRACRPGPARRSAARPRTGPAPACASRHEFRARSTARSRGRTCSTGLAADARRARALLRPGRGQDGRDPDQRHPRPPGQQQLQGDVHGCRSAPGTRRSTPATWRSTSEPRRPAVRQRIGFCFQGAASRRPSGRRSTPRSRRPWRPASWSCGPSAG